MTKFSRMAVAALLLLVGCGGGVTFVAGGGYGGNWPWPWPVNASVYVEKTYFSTPVVAAQTRLRLEGVNGNITITGAPPTGFANVSATLRAGSDTQADAQAALALMDVNVTGTLDELIVKTVQPAAPLGRQYLVHYTITIPSHLSVTVQTVNGHVTVTGINGSAVVELTNGDVDVDLTLPPAGQARLSAMNGSLRLTVPRVTTSATVDAMLSNGLITWTNLPLSVVTDTGQELSGTLGAGAGVIDLRTVNGNISLAGI